MKKLLSFLAVSACVGTPLFSQCVSLPSVNDTTVNATTGTCGAVVNFTAPVGTSTCSTSTVIDTFFYTGSVQNFIVPAGVTSVDVIAVGARGGFGFPATSSGGNGGTVSATLSVTPGSTLQIYVGGAGVNGTAVSGGAGGFNGGGNGGVYSGSYSGGGGGGASDVRTSPYGLNERLIVAGGGGGGAYDYSSPQSERGGDGGGLTGQDGYYGGVVAGSAYVGYGGTQVAGGAGGNYPGYCVGSSGILGIGGNGGTCTNSGGGGGGGYYGGGGGVWGGAGGGSSFTAPGATAVTHTQGTNSTGNGWVIVSYSGSSSGSASFSYTGSSQNFLVPSGVNSINVEVIGAQGGTGYPALSTGGNGGKVTATIAVTPGSTLQINVGGAGTNGSAGAAGVGGFNGGGNGGLYAGSYSGGGGGGASDIRVTPYGLNDRLVVAGGAGGGAYDYSTPQSERGGDGGGLTGQDGYYGGVVAGSAYVGYGGTQVAGGAGGNYPGYCVGSNGVLGIGGNGGTCTNSGGGGGGGYYGGGGGVWGGAGGGSSFTAPGATAVVHTQGFNSSGNGSVNITYGSSPTVTTTQIAGLPSGSTFPVGVTNQVFVATDGLGNYDTTAFTITVVDNQLPTITSPSNISVNTDPGVCTANPSLGTPSTGDNCAVATTTNNAPSSFPVGTTVVTWTVTDVNGNSSTSTQSVTVTDAQVPTISSPADVNVGTDPGVCTANPSLGTPATGDNCGVATTSNDAPSLFPIGTTIVTWTVTDVNGNSSTSTQSVTVTDGEDPTVTCPSNVTTCTPVVNGIGVTPADLCSSISELTYTLTGATVGNDTNDVSGTSFNIGTTTVTYLATDGAGNTGSCSFTVTILDCSGLEDENSLSDITLYPNPTSGEVNISMQNTNENVLITVTEVNGRVVKQLEVNHPELVNMNIGELPSGVYIFNIRTNEKVKTIKVIKK